MFYIVADQHSVTQVCICINYRLILYYYTPSDHNRNWIKQYYMRSHALESSLYRIHISTDCLSKCFAISAANLHNICGMSNTTYHLVTDHIRRYIQSSHRRAGFPWENPEAYQDRVRELEFITRMVRTGTRGRRHRIVGSCVRNFGQF